MKFLGVLDVIFETVGDLRSRDQRLVGLGALVLRLQLSPVGR